MATIGQYGHLLSEMTLQQVVDIGAEHLLTQNQKSESGLGNCKYSGNNGLCCAAAPFLLNDKLDAVFDQCDELGMTWHSAIASGYATPEHSTIINNLQTIHDDYHPREWLEELKLLYNEYNLNTDILTKFEEE